MQTILVVSHLMLAIGIVTLVLLQHGKGADAGAAFGSGASATVFGAKGSASFLSRATAVMATLFFLTSMALAYFASQTGEQQGLMDMVDELPATEVPFAAVESPEIPAPPVELEPSSTQSDLPPVPPAGAEGQPETKE